MRRASLLKVRVHASLLCGDAAGGVVDEHVLQQVLAEVVEAGDEVGVEVAAPFGEGGFEVGEGGYAGPVEFGGCAEEAGRGVSYGYTCGWRGDAPEDLEDLVNLGVTSEQRLARAHLGKDTADGPHIDTGGVLAATEQDLWGAVPQRDDLVGVCAEGHTKGSREPEIRELEVAVAVDQEILGLQVAVQHAVAVAVADALAQLAHEFLDHHVAEAHAAEVWARALGESLAAPAVADGEGFHVFLQVEVEELHDEVQLVAVGVHDVEQADDVGVVHLLQEGDLADGGGGDTFIFGFEADFLQGYNAATVQEVAGLVDDSVGSWEEYSQPLLRCGRASGVALWSGKCKLLTLSNLLQFLVVLHIERYCSLIFMWRGSRILPGALCSRGIVFSGAINEGQNKVASAACTCKIRQQDSGLNLVSYITYPSYTVELALFVRMLVCRCMLGVPFVVFRAGSK